MATGFSYRDLSDVERDQFLKDNIHGILAFSDGVPYAIPLGYFYRKGDLILGITGPGRKIDCAQKNPKICFTICRPRWQTPNLEGSCITAVVEGEFGAHRHVRVSVLMNQAGARCKIRHCGYCL